MGALLFVGAAGGRYFVVRPAGGRCSGVAGGTSPPSPGLGSYYFTFLINNLVYALNRLLFALCRAVNFGASRIGVLIPSALVALTTVLAKLK